MRVERFDYDLPADRIAQEPLAERDQARLMLLPAHAPIAHATVADLADAVAPGTLVVVNDTRVIPARILGTKHGTGGKAEVFLVRRTSETHENGKAVQRWRAMARA